MPDMTDPKASAPRELRIAAGVELARRHLIAALEVLDADHPARPATAEALDRITAASALLADPNEP
jgi:hypothetical protein